MSRGLASRPHLPAAPLQLLGARCQDVGDIQWPNPARSAIDRPRIHRFRAETVTKRPLDRGGVRDRPLDALSPPRRRHRAALWCRIPHPVALWCALLRRVASGCASGRGSAHPGATRWSEELQRTPRRHSMGAGAAVSGGQGSTAPFLELAELESAVRQRPAGAGSATQRQVGHRRREAEHSPRSGEDRCAGRRSGAADLMEVGPRRRRRRARGAARSARTWWCPRRPVASSRRRRRSP